MPETPSKFQMLEEAIKLAFSNNKQTLLKCPDCCKETKPGDALCCGQVICSICNHHFSTNNDYVHVSNPISITENGYNPDERGY